jgi:hypothetical protein
MPQSFDISVESPASVELFLSAFGNENYWRARLAIGESTADLKSLTVNADGAVNAVIAATLVRNRLPKLIDRLHRADLEVVQREKWSRVDGGRLRGEVSVAAPPIPFSAVWEVSVAPVQSGSRLTYVASVRVNIPIVGGTLEKSLAGQLAEGIVKGVPFTAEWIAEND